MELRVLRYFLAVAREESICRAAGSLHLSQPTLSRQMMDLETELGKKLFIRGNRRITLTEDGILLRKRAGEILELVEKTTNELSVSDQDLTGEIYIGAGETRGVHYLTQRARRLQEQYPRIHFHISSGDTTDVTEQLDKGLIDFGLLFDPVDLSKYDAHPLPVSDTWGLLLRRDDPLAEKASITAEDLAGLPLIISRRIKSGRSPEAWPGRDLGTWEIVSTYNLVYNASLMVEDGLGYALCLDGIINTGGDSALCFRPLDPPVRASMSVVWKKYQVFSGASEKFLELLRQTGGELDRPHEMPCFSGMEENRI